MLEMEERKAKIRKDKRIINFGKIRSMRQHDQEIKDLVKELKDESKQRIVQIQEMKVREVAQN